jgi:hypothetical protein
MELKKLLELIKEAIESVGSSYYSSMGPNDHVVDNERVFAYELYHQCRTRITTNDDFMDFGVHGEPGKCFPINDEKIKKFKYPDLAFHIPENNENNECVIEIKKHRDIESICVKSINEDLEKLILYTSGELNYKKGVFLSVGRRLGCIIESAINEEELKKLSGICNSIKINKHPVEFWVALENEDVKVVDSNSVKKIVDKKIKGFK